jgi:hypothetical protein
MHKTERKPTADDDTCDLLADDPYALRDIRSKFFNSAREVVAHNPAIVARM